MSYIKLLIGAAATVVTLGALVATASARQFSMSETRATATFPRLAYGGGFAGTRCNATLSAQFHSRTLSKVLETLVGLITAAAIGGCEAGSATMLTNTLPWHIRYAGFTGTLPNISSIATKMIDFTFKIREPVGFECLARSTAASPATGIYNREVGGRIVTAAIGGTMPCSPLSLTLAGTSNSITPALTVTLI